MMRWSIPAALAGTALAGFSSSAIAAPVACGAGTLDIAVASDTPLAGTAFNVGQKATFTAVAAGVAPTSFAWTVPGPHIKDYVEDLGTRASTTLASPVPWSTSALTSANLSASSVSLYFRPSAAQIHPLNGPAETRTVTLVAGIPGGSCTVSQNVTVERNMTDPARQPEDFYTTNHRAAATTNAGMGNVIDEHMYWHNFVQDGDPGHWLQFLPWHSYFLRRFDDWRQTFGYAPVAPWYPGRPLPTGPEFDHDPALRLAYNPLVGRLPYQYSLAGPPTAGASPNRLADFASVDSLTGAFEFTLHGIIHCQIGINPPNDPSNPDADFFATSGPYYGSMCMASSPKDPMFWRWHGFIDRMYANFCRLKSPAPICHNLAAPSADPWMGDNAADIAAGGAVPSPGIHWMSPDVWNRRSEITSDTCLPRTPPHLNTVGGVVRDCGSEADHENPVTGSTNFLYATVRNSGRAQRNLYAEVAVYIASAATGLSWPADFKLLPDSRQFITLNLEPGQVTDIGPIPWVPPSPAPSDHFCLYVKILSVQETPPTEGTNVDSNVANSNSIAWRNIKVVPAGSPAMFSKFIVRNIWPEAREIHLDIMPDQRLQSRGQILVTLDPRLQRAAANLREIRGAVALGRGRWRLEGPRVRFGPIPLRPREQGMVQLDFRGDADATGDIIVVQQSGDKQDGGTTLRISDRRQR